MRTSKAEIERFIGGLFGGGRWERRGMAGPHRDRRFVRIPSRFCADPATIAGCSAANIAFREVLASFAHRTAGGGVMLVLKHVYPAHGSDGETYEIHVYAESADPEHGKPVEKLKS